MTGMELVETIRRAIDADARPQREIAEAAKINAVNLSQFKHGGWLRVDSLCRLAHALGLEITVKERKKRK